jgi:hypothetical protein
MFIHLAMALIKKENYLVVASGRVGLKYEDFSKKINKKYLASIISRNTSKRSV